MIRKTTSGAPVGGRGEGRGRHGVNLLGSALLPRPLDLALLVNAAAANNNNNNSSTAHHHNTDNEDHHLQQTQKAAAAPAAAVPEKQDDTTKHKSTTITAGRSPPSGAAAIIYPTEKDILLGRGRPYQHHRGNEAMRRLVERHQDKYSSIPRNERGTIVNQLVQVIESSGGRFLKKKKKTLATTTTTATTTSLFPARTLLTRMVLGQEKVPAAPLVYEDDEDIWELATKGEAYEKMAHALRSKKPGRGQHASSSLGKKTGGTATTTSSTIAKSISGGGSRDKTSPTKKNKNKNKKATTSATSTTRIPQASNTPNTSVSSSPTSFNEIAIQMAIQGYIKQRRLRDRQEVQQE